MGNKDKLKQELWEQALGKKANHRHLSSIYSDLESILETQKESIKELSQGVSDQDLEKINKEIEKDFGVRIVDEKTKESKTLEELCQLIKESSYYDDFIDDLFSFIKKSTLVEKKEYSLLLYNYKDVKEVLEMVVNKLYQNQYLHSDIIKLIDFSSYSSKIEVFYQDMYDCLHGDSQFVVFKNIDQIPIPFINSIISLLEDKKMPLLHRYIESQGVLKETNNMLVKDALSSIEWHNKYIILLSSSSLNDITDKFGTQFIKAIDEVKEFKNLTQEERIQYIEQLINKFNDKVKQHIHLQYKDDLLDFIIKEKIENIEEYLQDILERIIDIKEEYQCDSLELIVEDHALYFDINEHHIPFVLEDESFKDIDAQLQQLVGLDEVKKYLQSLKQYYAAFKKRKAQGKKVMDVSKHLIFTGNPGTGKTTVARILSQYLKSADILKSGHLIEVSRKDLVGQYVGHTAVLTSQVIQSALGGVLFIDEAYSLYRGQNDSFGLEAIDTLVKGMEDNRDNLVVVLAGYKKEMEEFLTSNSGLRSRFSNIIEFEDYTGEELYRIVCQIASGKDYTVDETCKEQLTMYLEKRNKVEGGNGRLARNVVEKAMIEHSLRDSDEDILILEDFLKGSDTVES